MPPPKITGDKINCRVKLGSALERLLQGRDVTETLHVMAELIERAPQAVRDELPVKGEGHFAPLAKAAMEGGPRDAVRAAAIQGSPAELVAATQEPENLDEMVLIGHGRDQRYVTLREAMAMAAEQAPGGLVVAGIDHGDEDLSPTSETDVPLSPVVQDDDMSHLI